MSKKKQGSSLGRQIIKDRFGKTNKTTADSFLHTRDLKDGYEWGRLNLQSVTEQNNLEEFLSTAELAGTEFTAEKLNVQFVKSDTYGGLPQGDDLKKIHGLHREHHKLLRIPRRPSWNKQMSASHLDQIEREAFLDWRRSLASLQEVEGLVMTPYEKNLDFWRQLWRVIERSDIVVQIVDARNPMLFYCADLEQYVHEIDKTKVCILLINKADYLNQTQRDLWAAYFTTKGIRIAFWSALEEVSRQEKESRLDSQGTQMEQEEDIDDDEGGDDDEEETSSVNRLTESDRMVDDIDDDDDDEFVDKYGNKISAPKSDTENKMTSDATDSIDHVTVDDPISKSEDQTVRDMETELCDKTETNTDKLSESQDGSIQPSEATGKSCSSETELTAGLYSKSDCEGCSRERTLADIQNTGHIYLGPELLDLFRSIYTGTKAQNGITTVGMVGYPNVGKSSTINAILRMKKVPVSATPGRTKHFQTLFVDSELMLCDCPGLVFPSFVTTKADLVVSGILPVDQMRDHSPPTSLVCQLIPRQTLERTYGIIIPPPGEAEDPNRPPSAFELLNSYGAMRGFMTARGVPDCPRSSRYILKDFVNGKLLYCHPPPDCDAMLFNRVIPDGELAAPDSQKEEKNINPDVPMPSQVDKDFFRKVESTVHSRTPGRGVNEDSSTGSPHSSQASLSGKPWKRHNNRKKKEKLRRVYGHLDG